MNFEIERKEIKPEKTYNYEFVTSIPRIKACDITYNEYFENYMLPNHPIIIESLSSKWESSQFWVKDNTPNLHYLSNKYGNLEVTIYNCSKRYFNSQATYKCLLSDYFNRWKQKKTNNDNDTLSTEYLKDWHLKLISKNDNFYEVPVYFASDWLNEYHLECLKDDYRFVYVGPKGTWTPFHSDVFTSYSWSANVSGKKRWWLFPPGQENNLRDKFNNLPYDVENCNNSNSKYIEVIQNPGEALFVPSGWFHQVWNLEDTISINHNWVNGCNISFMWSALKYNLDLVRKEISDVEDMENFEDHCQTMLNASFGMNYYNFYEFIKFISESRIDMKSGIKSKILFHKHEIGENHILFDLKAIRSVLKLFEKCSFVRDLKYFETVQVKPCDLLDKIDNVL